MTLLPLVADMVTCVAPLCRDLHGNARTVNAAVSALVENYGDRDLHASTINFGGVIKHCQAAVLKDISTRPTHLNWIVLVHKKQPRFVEDKIEELNEACLSCLNDGSEDVARKCLEVLCTMAKSDKDGWARFLKPLVAILGADKGHLIGRVPMIFKQLQVQSCDAKVGVGFEPQFVFTVVAGFLSAHDNKPFVATMVMTLSLMLVTAPEFHHLRQILRDGVSNAATEKTFAALYGCWSHNAAWAICLCFLTKEYHEAHRIVLHIGSHEVNAHTLLQLDRLLQLLETPVFAYLRLGLANPASNPYLVRSLYGILMILPQSSSQFQPLLTRLQSAAQLQSTLVGVPPEKEAHGAGGKDKEKKEPLFKSFIEVQRAVEAYEQKHRPT